jgi:hypothetical protein
MNWLALTLLVVAGLLFWAGLAAYRGRKEDQREIRRAIHEQLRGSRAPEQGTNLPSSTKETCI